MACVVKTLIDKDNDISLPPLTVPNLGKALILIRAGEFVCLFVPHIALIV
jgi:hypothetical protein